VKILVVGDAGCHTGFATVIHNLGERWVDRGHEVHVLAINYLGDYYPGRMALYPANLKNPADIYGYSRSIEMLARVMPDVVFILNDPPIVANFLLNNPFDPEKILWNGYRLNGHTYRPPIVAYLPIDGHEYPKMWDVLAEGTIRVAMTEHGKTVMPEAKVVYHGVDHSVFFPRPKREAKKELGYDPDCFLVLRVDKNSYRKDYPATWRALRPILRAHDDVFVHFHCLPTARDGYDLRAIVWNDEDIRDRLSFSPNIDGFLGWSQEKLALLYSAADVFVSTSHGEGFGLTMAEALACGTPVIAQKYSSIPEVVGPGGILIDPGPSVHVPLGHMQRLPDIDNFTYWIERFYGFSQSRRDELARAGAKHVKKFDWDKAAAQMEGIMTDAVQNSG
jgi:glycosyltransferase involved in cell wall biosynthesis